MCDCFQDILYSPCAKHHFAVFQGFVKPERCLWAQFGGESRKFACWSTVLLSQSKSTYCEGMHAVPFDPLQAAMPRTSQDAMKATVSVHVESVTGLPVQVSGAPGVSDGGMRGCEVLGVGSLCSLKK